jgi:hypothetical protein
MNMENWNSTSMMWARQTEYINGYCLMPDRPQPFTASQLVSRALRAAFNQTIPLVISLSLFVSATHSPAPITRKRKHRHQKRHRNKKKVLMQMNPPIEAIQQLSALTITSEATTSTIAGHDDATERINNTSIYKQWHPIDLFLPPPVIVFPVKQNHRVHSQLGYFHGVRPPELSTSMSPGNSYRELCATIP